MGRAVIRAGGATDERNYPRFVCISAKHSKQKTHETHSGDQRGRAVKVRITGRDMGRAKDTSGGGEGRELCNQALRVFRKERKTRIVTP